MNAHPFVPGVVAVCDIRDGAGVVQIFSVLYHSPVKE